MIRRYSACDQIDEWLDSQGFYRKHTAKDGSCLFRAVSEQIFNSQVFHLDVRQTCVNYMKRNQERFEEFIEGSFDNYLNALENPTTYCHETDGRHFLSHLFKEWAGHVEMTAMALLLNRDFLIFQEVGKPAFAATDNGCNDKVMLYFSHGNHYDSVYPKGFIINAAFCQSLVYEILYKEVFRIGDEVDLAVQKMLHDKAYAKLRKDSATSVDSNSALFDFVTDHPDKLSDSDEKKAKDIGLEIRRALAQGFPPFPYKVAKALDPEIYRNVEFDVWNEAVKDEMIFEPGVKCLVRLDKEKPDSYHAHIQEITPNKGPVTVYIVELGKKQTVPYDSLEQLPYKVAWQTSNRFYKSISTSYYQKSHINGNQTVDMDKFKGRKKYFKKGKFRDVAVFPIRVARGPQNYIPRLPNNQAQFDSSFLPLGRGRGGPPAAAFHGVAPRNPPPHIKWISSPSPRRYNNRLNNGNNNNYFASNDYNNNINNHKDFCQQSQNGTTNFTSQSIAPTSVNWVNSLADVAQNHKFVNSGQADNEISVGPQHTVSSNIEATTSGVPSATSTNTTQSYSSGVPTIMPTTPTATIQDSRITSSSQGSPFGTEGTSPQSLAIYPCPYFTTGLCVPYEPQLYPINYSVSRSQDPNGNDLPFQDLATLRFFFNLGLDYFRMASSGPPMSPHVVWNYGVNGQQTAPPINSYLTSVSSTDGHEESSGGSNTAVVSPCLSDNDVTLGTQPQQSPVEELYETAYIYSSSPMGFMPGLWTHPVDYNMSPSEYKSGLMLNDQGILSLSPQCPTTITQNQARDRSDSGSSSRSQRVEWNNENYYRHKGGTTQSFDSGSGSYNKGPQQQLFQRDGGPNLPSHQQRPNHHRKQQQQQQQSPAASFVGPAMLAYGMSGQSGQSSFSPILSASPTPLGIYSGSSPVAVGPSPFFTTQPPGGTAYYSPPHPPATATLVYSPPTHPFPYFSTSAH